MSKSALNSSDRATVNAYTKEYDAALLRLRQVREYARSMDALLARYDAGEQMTSDEISALTKHFVG